VFFAIIFKTRVVDTFTKQLKVHVEHCLRKTRLNCDGRENRLRKIPLEKEQLYETSIDTNGTRLFCIRIDCSRRFRVSVRTGGPVQTHAKRSRDRYTRVAIKVQVPTGGGGEDVYQ